MDVWGTGGVLEGHKAQWEFILIHATFLVLIVLTMWWGGVED